MNKLRALDRYPIAVAAGLLLAASFPNFGVAGFAWIAPGLMIAAALGRTWKQAFRLGYVAAFSHYLASLYWLLLIPVTGFPILGWIALGAFLSLFPATWVALAVGFSPWNKNLSSTEPTATLSPLFSSATFNAPAWFRRVGWALFCAALWVTTEMIIARIFGGFPWNLLGASQYRILPLIQIASVTGVYGVSFIVAWTSVSLLSAVLTIARRPTAPSAWAGDIVLPFVTGAIVVAGGLREIANADDSPRAEVKLALVQPSIPQTMIWDSENDMARFRELIDISTQALAFSPDVLIWPEAAIPGYPRYHAAVGRPIAALARENRVWMIVGADDVSVDSSSTNFYNASLLISPEGVIAESYRKRALVMFGEYIPLERWLPFIRWFTPVTGSYRSGDRAVQFEMAIPDRTAGENTGPDVVSTKRIKVAPLICFEDNFGHLVVDYAEPDTDFLVNLTNNGWFGEGAAQWQHAVNATFRSVENRIPLVRSTNTGLTCWIDSHGRWRQIFRDSSGTIYGKGFMIAGIPILAEGELRERTFYNRYGDIFGWSCLALTSITILLGAALKRVRRVDSAG